MSTPRLLLPLACVFVMSVAQAAAAPETVSPRSADAGATLVVYNESDEESVLLGRFYAQKRNIPIQQIIGLRCSQQEEISRKDYDSTIAEPLRQAFKTNGWWTLRPEGSALGPVESCRIRYVALMRGIPLRIAAEKDYPGDKPNPANPVFAHNEAAVDSELATLSSGSRVISGAVNNPYFKAMGAFAEAGHPEMMLVCRLDGPSPAVVRRMIVDALETEKTGLYGFWYLDARAVAEPGLKEGDQWLYNATDDARKNGYPVILDNGPAMFPENYPMRYASVYAGWYSENVAGPFVRPGFRFLPGAIAVHIHSFSATTVRDPKSRWVGPLLEAGAAATVGNVYEPYLTFTPHLDIFLQRLRMGFTFAESAYMSQRALSWMTTVVGDPLYRPCPPLPELTAQKNTAEWETYRKGALLYQKDPAAGTKLLQEAAKRLKSGIIWECLGLLQMGAENRTPSIDSFAQAREAYTNPEDIIRAVIHEVIQLRGAGREKEAEKIARKVGQTYSGLPATTILRLLIPGAFMG